MKITYLGQAGLLIKVKETLILVDPYLSNNVEKFEPQNKRRQPINESFLKIEPDYILITHAHLDHYDLETLKYYKNCSKTACISPISVYMSAKNEFSNWKHILAKSGDYFDFDCFKIDVLSAFHSDKEAIGFVLTIEDKKIYITGDTLFKNELVTNALHHMPYDLLFVPVNGYGNNMNDIEANDFSKLINSKLTIPYHYGMFDSIQFEDIKVDNKKRIKIYESINF